MFRYLTTASVLAAMALTAPAVCQAAAIDPQGSLKEVQALSAAGKAEEASALCDKVIQKFSGKDAVSQQFNYVLPYYAWEKAQSYFKAKDYAKAYEAYKAFSEEPRWKDATLLAKAKEALPTQPEAFAPFLTWSVFQMGYCRFMEAAAAEREQAGPKFEAAIAPLEQYLDMLQKNQVSATEKKQRLDGQVCFLLLQCYILKSTPDFEKASEYLEKSRRAKGKVPEEMAVAGLNSILAAATADPKNIGWVGKLINSNISSYKVEPARMGRNAAKYLKYGTSSAQLVNRALKEGNMEIAVDAYNSANTLFGLIPDVREVCFDADNLLRRLGKKGAYFKGTLSDRNTGAKISADNLSKLSESYKKLEADKQMMEAFSMLYSANMALTYGSPRLAKAGYQIVYDRYRDLQMQSKDEGLKPMRNTNIFQLAQLCYATGDEESGANFEKMLEGEDVGGDRSKSMAFNKMRRLLKEQKWEEVPAASDAVMKAYIADPSNKFYISAQFAELAAYYKMQDYDKLIQSAETFLHGDNLKPGTEKNSLKPEEVLHYQCQAYYFLLDAHVKKASKDPKEYDKALAVFDEYKGKITSTDIKENELGPNMYFTAGDVYLKKAAAESDEAAAEALQKKAIETLSVVTTNWKESQVYPNCELLIASVIVAGKDESIKDQAIAALERCADAAIKLQGGKQTAANALYWLASYTPEIARAGEDDAARAARCKTYRERFWKEADYEGNPFALQEVSLDLGTVSTKEEFDAQIAHAREIIAREATYAHEHDRANPELEKTINGYVAAYVDGSKKYDDKELTLEEKAEHFNNFPGIKAEDKYARAIFRMALIDSMNKAMAAIKEDGEAKVALQNDIEKTFREMTATFKPEDLTDFICVNVGDYLVNYVGRFEDPSTKQDEINTAVSYYDAVIERKKDAELVLASRLGKANALAYSKDAAQQATAAELYTAVSASADPNVSGPALHGLAKLHMRAGNYAEAITAARKFIDNRTNVRNRLSVLILLGEAYSKSGNDKDALLTYMNIYNQNKGSILYSAPACKAIMEILWKRNNPETGDRLKGTYKHSDHWTAWDTGQKYVDLIIRSGIDKKMQPEERDEYNKVFSAVSTYAADAGVQREDKASKDFQRKLQKK
ncbi:MAG: hypothetical protein ACI4O9_07445 [Akkermansia sp.]